MKKIIKNGLRILLKIISVLLLIVLIIYFGLWIYVYNSVPNELKQEYDQTIILSLSEEHYRIIWFTLTENNWYKFKWYPFILEIFIRDHRDNVDNTASIFILSSNNIYTTGSRLSAWNIEYGLSRYIRYDNDFKKCLSLIISKAYMGNELYGIINASEYYYNKNIYDLTNEELISLTILIINHSRYVIGSSFSINKIEEIINKYIE